VQPADAGEGLIDDQAPFKQDDLDDPDLESDEDIDGEVDVEGGAATQKRRA
jgi:hypothetical protein